jgi:hypothetical protein
LASQWDHPITISGLEKENTIKTNLIQ